MNIKLSSNWYNFYNHQNITAFILSIESKFYRSNTLFCQVFLFLFTYFNSFLPSGVRFLQEQFVRWINVFSFCNIDFCLMFYYFSEMAHKCAFYWTITSLSYHILSILSLIILISYLYLQPATTGSSQTISSRGVVVCSLTDLPNRRDRQHKPWRL